eukprot:8131598-Pyramimonas_sp.AAC.1
MPAGFKFTLRRLQCSGIQPEISIRDIGLELVTHGLTLPHAQGEMTKRTICLTSSVPSTLPSKWSHALCSVSVPLLVSLS